jgi:hypothetical protein
MEQQMKGKKSYVQAVFITIILSGLLLVSAYSFAGTAREKGEGEIAVIERDTIQTRNFVPVINHEAMIVNLTAHSLKIDIDSPLPGGKYRKDDPFAAFGRNSKLGAPTFSPFKVPIDDYIILEKPLLEEKDKMFSYYWRNVVLPPGQAVVAQYDNSYAPLKDFYRDFGMEIAGLLIGSQYSVEKRKDIYRLSLVLTLQNQGEQHIKEMLFRIFVPEALSLENRDEPLQLVKLKEIFASENLNVTTSSIVDGFGNTARGIDASLELDTLEAGASVQLALQIDCHKEAERGEIYPIMYIIGRRKLTRLWPPTIISGAYAKSERKFHYLLYNLVIGDRRIFRLDKSGITVVPAETIKKPTYGSGPQTSQ